LIVFDIRASISKMHVGWKLVSKIIPNIVLVARAGADFELMQLRFPKKCRSKNNLITLFNRKFNQEME
jgi:hypothetical protein